MARLVIGVNDLVTVNPELAAQWHPTKNGTLTPKDILPLSNKKVWWSCPRFHEWDAAISHRMNGTGCPYCAGKRPIVGVTDLGTVNPELAAQWHPTKNGEMTPQNFAPKSHKKVWWVCPLLHEWEASIDSRSRGRGCSICAGQRVLIGFNDLLTKNPELAAQWHPTKNGMLTPQNVSGASGRKAWWLCPQLHEWEVAICYRLNGSGCPYCAGTAILVGFNDLAAVNPALAAQWHPTKNSTITSHDVTANSGKKVWWLCSLLHEWETAIFQRSNGTGCPICAGKRVLAGFNDLATANPELAEQWHPTKNSTITSKDVTSRSSKKIWWWKCALDHEWKANVANRDKGSGCPKCAGRIPIVGSTDLATVKPELAEQWHPTKNGSLTPQHVTAGSSRKVWWVCSLFHEWETTVEKRFSGSGCPTCSTGKTENSFREAFERLSKLAFKANRISLVRLSRKFDRAQIDMLNDELKIVVEYDGEWTHGARSPEGKTLEQKLTEDKETTQALVDIGYKVIRIRDHSFVGRLPFVPLDAGYELSVFQITYKSYGKDKADIDVLTQKIIEEKAGWFKMDSKVLV